MQQRAAGQTAQDHGGHQLIHVHFLWTRLASGGHRQMLGLTQMLDKPPQKTNLTSWER